MKKQVAIGTKLLTSVGALLLMLIAVAGSALYSIGAMQAELSDSVTATAKRMDLDQTTQTTAATAEEGASAAEQLSAQAQTMGQAVRQLRVLVDGSAAVL